MSDDRPLDHPLVSPLLAYAPDPALRDALALFGQFVGSWDLEVRWYRDGKPVRDSLGEWHFGWVLGGRAVQDVWIVPPRSDRGEPDLYEHGTSLRFFDAAAGVWRSTWHGPVQGSVRTFTARAHEGEILLEGERLDGCEIRWVFSRIRPESFSWRFEQFADGDWRLLQSFECRRQSPATAADG